MNWAGVADLNTAGAGLVSGVMGAYKAERNRQLKEGTREYREYLKNQQQHGNTNPMSLPDFLDALGLAMAGAYVSRRQEEEQKRANDIENGGRSEGTREKVYFRA